MNESIQSPPNSDNAAPADASSPEGVASTLRKGSPKQQQQQIEALLQADQTEALILFLVQHEGRATAAVGQILQAFAQALPPGLSAADLHSQIEALVPLSSDRDIDYGPLRDCLLAQGFKQADRITLEKLCELAGATAVARKWLYFSEVSQFPSADLRTIDFLWRVFSQNKFGFSVQRELWLGVEQNWERLWPKIGWRDETWTRYPDGFTWSLAAPRGHLPLSNQLRGVRVMAALMDHPAWREP